MGKLVAWLVLIFVVLLALRVINARNRRVSQPNDGAGPAGGLPKIEPMVRCERCGIYLPRNEALTVPGGHACADKNCSTRQAR